MKRDGKQAVISELKELFTANQNFYIADTSGLTVAEVSKLRRMCFKQGVKLKVAKNTLIKKALDSMDGDYSGVYGSLKGTSGLMLCETANVPAKILKDFRKTSERPTLKAAFVESAERIASEAPLRAALFTFTVLTIAPNLKKKYKSYYGRNSCFTKNN